jgi:predicted phage-related endonuclease
MAKVMAETANMTRSEWLAKRSVFVGASETAALIQKNDGSFANPYSSPVVLYMIKTGQYIPSEPGEAAYWGNVLEEVVAQEFLKRYNEELVETEEYKTLSVIKNGRGIGELKPARIQKRNAIFAHDELDYMCTNLDRLMFCPALGKCIVECKTANQFLSSDWEGEDVPDQYYIQVQHQMEVMDIDHAFIAVLIGGQKFKKYYIPRDREFGAALVGIIRNFWENHVLAGVRPEIDGSKATTDMYKSLYDTSESGTTLELPSQFVAYVEQRDEFKKLEESYKESKTEMENKIKEAMKGTEVAFAGPHKITWKTQSDGKRPLKIKLGKAE